MGLWWWARQSGHCRPPHDHEQQQEPVLAIHDLSKLCVWGGAACVSVSAKALSASPLWNFLALESGHCRPPHDPQQQHKPVLAVHDFTKL